NNGKLLYTIEGHSNRVNSAIFSLDGKQILTASYDKTVKLWDVVSKNLLKVFEGHNEIVTDAKFSPNGEEIISVSYDGMAKLYSIHDATEKYSFKHSSKGLESYIKRVAYSPNGEQLFIASWGLAKLFDIKTRDTIYTLKYPANDFQYSLDGKRILIASADNNISEIIDSQKGTLLNTFEGHTNYLYSAQFSTDNKLVITSSADGSIIIWNSETGKQLIQQFIFDGNPNKWVHIHPSGLFDASSEAMELMYWTKGLEVIEFSQLKDRYWEPGLWEKVMKGEVLRSVRDMQELKLQPQVEIEEYDEKSGKIPVTLTKRDGGYGKVTLLINGKEIEADARGETFDASKEKQTIYLNIKDHPYLKDSLNTIAVKASSEDGFVTGRSEEKTIRISLEKTKPHLYAISIGTGTYSNPNINLRYPEKDAKSISTALQIGAEDLFGKEQTHIYTLTTSDQLKPTKQVIKKVFDEIAQKATSSDVLVLYLSGHGITWGGENGDFYYLTTEVSSASSEAFNDATIRNSYAISTAEFTEWIKSIPANKQVMIIDACSSGKAVENLMASREIDASSIKAINRMKDRTGMFVISGSAADAASYEASRYGQGLLTYSILQAMKGAKLRDGKFFDADLILNHAREVVPELAKDIGGIQQPQLLIPKGGSFDFGVVDENSVKEIPLNAVKPVFVRTTFVDTEEFTDLIGLSKLVDEQLYITSSRGNNASLVFLDTREFPEAYRLSGGYMYKNGLIALTLKIKGPNESEHKLVAKSKEELAEKIIQLAELLK
ncbi:MAG: hypothetical protein E6Q89_02135, partial [Bacteroidia bacterium]